MFEFVRLQVCDAFEKALGCSFDLEQILAMVQFDVVGFLEADRDEFVTDDPTQTVVVE